MSTAATILLSFDLEEFDLPTEYGDDIALAQQFSIGKKGLDAVEHILDATGITTTIFTTGCFALEYPEAVKRLSDKHEIASHTLNHSVFEMADLVKSKEVLENVTQKKVYGLRMPRMQQVDMQAVKDAGYQYDSSLNPTYIPGRYDHRKKPRILFKEAGLVRLPVSVTPNLRIPLFWLSFKNFPYSLYLRLALKTLKKDGYLSLYFHPWEFTAIEGFSIPTYITRNAGEKGAEKLGRLIADLSNYASFDSIENYIRTHAAAENTTI